MTGTEGAVENHTHPVDQFVRKYGWRPPSRRPVGHQWKKGVLMNKSEVEAAIEVRLKERKKAVLNRNAFGALFGAFGDPVAALGQVFLGRGDAIDQEKQRIAQDVILELLCKIDESLSQANAQSAQRGIRLGGLIETISHGGESLTGLSIGAKSGPVTLLPGSHVRTVATGVRNVTGVKIGGTDEK